MIKRMPSVQAVNCVTHDLIQNEYFLGARATGKRSLDLTQQIDTLSA